MKQERGRIAKMQQMELFLQSAKKYCIIKEICWKLHFTQITIFIEYLYLIVQKLNKKTLIGNIFALSKKLLFY